MYNFPHIYGKSDGTIEQLRFLDGYKFHSYYKQYYSFDEFVEYNLEAEFYLILKMFAR